MYNDRYINAETEAMADFISDSANQRERYIVRPLSPEHFNMLKAKLPFTNLSKATLDDLNSLVPGDAFGNKEVAFIRLNDQQYKSVGLVALGQFHSNDNYEAIAPDSLDFYLAKRNEDGKVRLWRSLKTTPGFETVYRFGKSPFVTKQMIVPGASRDHRGSMAVDTSSYEVIQATRDFFNKAIEVTNSKEYRILHGILNEDYSVMDSKPIYKRSDTWSVKNNELANGKLENILFTSSQIHDADFLKPKTSMGEQYMVSKKLNNEVFEMASSGFRRGASRNRINFIKDLNKNRDIIYKVEDGKPLDELEVLREQFISFNTKEFRDKLKVFGQLEEVFGNEEIKDNSYLENFRKKKVLSGSQIKNLIGDDKFDYLYKRESFMKELYKIVEEANEERKIKNKYSRPETFDDHKFNKFELKKLIDKYNEEYKEIEKELVKEMKERISSKIDASFDRRYYNYMKDVKPEDKKKMLKAIEMDMTRDFYDKYNEKIDLYEIMVKNRRNSVISEAEAVADRVRFEYSKDGKTIIGVKPITDKAFDYITDLSKDVGLRWGYYKARIDIGASKFDKMTLGNRLNYAREYLDKNQSYRDLFKKVSEKSMFGKYDTYDNFKTAQTGEFKYNFLDDAVVARTNDKIIARLNTDNSLSVNGAMRYGDKIFRINLNLNGYDGFNKNDYIKELSSQMQASMKEMDLSTQKFIESQAKTGRKVYKLYKLIDKAQASLKGKDDDEYKKLNKMKSFLLGQKDRTKSSYGAIWGLKNGELVYLKDGPRDKKGRLLHQDGVTNLESYNEIYDNIIDYMKSKYNKEVGYALYDTYRMRYGKEKEDMNSLSELNYEIVRKFGHQIDNTVFTAILNNDQLINTTGASKQSSLIHGNTYLGHLGVAQPGLAWNKVTQRTFQAQDILGEQYVEINGKKKTVSEINSEIISRLNLSGVGKRHGRYVTDELYKGAVNRMNKQYGLNNSDYRRGEVYKTFAIGDVNSTIRDSGINTFSLSFQEGMTAAKSMVLTTNAIRNKEFTLNIDEFNLDNLNISKKDLHKKLLTQEGLDEVLSMVINENLYGTIAGRKKYAEMLTKLSNPDILRKIDIEDKDSYKGALSYYEAMANVIGFTPKKFDNYTDNSSKRMAITKEIYKHLENLRDVTGAVALPTTSQGKNVITNENYIRTKNELKPEYGFSISDYRYNAQTRNIELMLENIGLSTQGTKGQTNGAKFTISEIYDFLKVRANNKDQFIDAVFNNKTEKREQTGMIVHTALQTVFSHVYDTAKLEGVSRLKENMKELLKDMNVNIIIDEQRNTYRIDERYLTVNPETNNIMTIEEFQKYMREPTENLSKLFNDKGRVILDNLIKKYSSQYNDGDTIQKQGAHIGILNAMTQAYTQTFKDMGKTEIPFMIKNATVSGIANDTETQFGDGNFWLLRLSSERVNSNTSKKKESGLKIGREMAQRQIAAGYRELVDFTERRNKKRLSSFLGDVFNGMSNAELLQQVYSHKKDFSLEQLNLSMSETLRNGIFFNLDELKDDDYLFNDKEIYLTHTKFMADSLLGKAITDKNLGGLKDGKLEKDINVVVHDKDINAFTESLKKSIKNVRGYFEDRVDNSTEIIKNYQGDDIDKLKQSLEYDKKTVEFFNNLELLNFTDIRKTEKQITSILDKNLTNKNIVEKLSGQDLYRTKEFLGLVRRNLKDTYSLDQLRTIMKTGNILTTVNLEYDVDDVTNQIVASKSFNKLRNIARKYYDLNKASHAEKLFMDKMDNKDKTLVDDIYSSMVDYYSNKTDLQSFSVFGDLFNSLNFGEKNKFSDLQDTAKKIFNSEHMLRAEIDATNNFFQEYYNKLGLTEDQFRTQLDKAHEHMKSMDDEISKDKQKIFDKLKDAEMQSSIKAKLNKALFENEKLRNNKKMASFYEDKIRDHFSNSFDLLNEYISVPANSEGLFQKKGSITDKQKFRVNSSFVANPLEGSNLLNKFEGLLFNARDHKELTKNFKEFQEFLGADVVNDRLFTDSEGVNWLDKLGDIKDNRAYKKGLETAREVFSENLSNISEVTITDKRYMSAFRTDKADWTDDFTGESISKKGYVRELGFLSRHPQQTINHMGAVTNITLDTDHDIKNKFARAVLTYLPKEKNNAAVITFGKKTMLYRRGDHDGDKVQLAMLDFIDDPSVSTKTKTRAYLDFLLKNKSLGEWDDERGMYKSFTGSLITVDDKGKQVLRKLSSDREEALQQIENILGINEEQLNMRTKSFNAYSHAVYERARKELKKHYNAIYEMTSELQSEARKGFLLSTDEVGLVKGVMNIAKKGVKSSIARERIYATDNVLKSIENNKLDVSSFIGNMDLVGQTAIYLLRKGMYTGNNSEELYKKTVKEIDKFISRGNFDEFYKQSNTKAIFDELTGQRNTGLTHSYATKLMMGSVELSKIDPTDVMSKIDYYARNSNLDINALSEMKRKQEYYSLSMDLLVDNMIESAISAKHGLTLGGLEGSKIFINELLNYDSDNLNNKVIQMFDDVFINNDKIKTTNLLENILFYKQGFDKREGVLETIRDEVSAKGLNTDIFMKQFDLGSKEFKSSFKDLVTEKEMNTYLAFGKRYKDEVRNIEMDIFKHGMKKQYVDIEEYKIFQGLNLFGELLIQNDPGLEYDTDVVNELFEQYNKGKITYSELMKNSDVQNLKYQAQISLGSAASISNVGKMREYLSSFVTTFENKKEWDNFEKEMTAELRKTENNRKLLNRNDISEIFDGNFNIKNKFEGKIEETESFKELYSKYLGIGQSNNSKFYNSVVSNGADPMKAYLEVMNNNYTIFSQNGLTGSDSLERLKEFKDNTSGSLNSTSLDESLENVDAFRAKTIRNLMDKMSERDIDFQTFNTDELMKELNLNPKNRGLQKEIISQVKQAIDDTLFSLNKDKLTDLKLGNESKMVKIKFADKLSDTEENLKKWGKLYQIGTKKTKTSSPINRLFDLLETDNRDFIIDDLSIFRGKRGFEQKQFDKVYKFAQTHNLYFSERIARQIFNHHNMADRILKQSERTNLAQSLLNARRYLGEDFTRENVIKRMNQKLDLTLATTTAVNRFINDNPELNKDGFKTKLQKNLGLILKDFHTVDKSIENNYVNPNYIKMAKSYVDSNRIYRSVGLDGRDPVRFDIARKSLKRFMKEKREWLEENNIDSEFFEKLALSELTNQKYKSNNRVKSILTNVARALSNEDITDIGDIGKTFDKLDKIPKNAKKYGLAAILGSGIFALGSSIVKPFLAGGNGTYTLSNNVNKLNEKQIMEKLNFSNGMSANMVTEELKGLTKNTYIDVNKKELF